MEEEEALREKEALEQLKLRPREEEEKAKKFKWKEKLEVSPLPSPEYIHFPETSSDHMDREEEIQHMK